MKALLLLCPLLSVSGWGQAPPSVPAPWEVSKSVAQLAAQAAELKPLLAQLTPREWVEKGAADTYVEQWQGAQDELGYLDQAARTLETQPEKLTAALETYFRLQAVEWRLESLAEGARKYQNPAVGDLLASALGAHVTGRDQLRQYITDLAAQKEQEFAVVEREAQRCRDEQNRTPARGAAPAKAPGPAKRNAKGK